MEILDLFPLFWSRRWTFRPWQLYRFVFIGRAPRIQP